MKSIRGHYDSDLDTEIDYSSDLLSLGNSEPSVYRKGRWRGRKALVYCLLGVISLGFANGCASHNKISRDSPQEPKQKSMIEEESPKYQNLPASQRWLLKLIDKAWGGDADYLNSQNTWADF